MFLRLSFQLRSACGSRDRSVRVRVRVRTVGRSGLPLLLHLLVHANLPLRAIRGMIFAHPVDFQSLVAKVLCHTCCSYPHFVAFFVPRVVVYASSQDFAETALGQFSNSNDGTSVQSKSKSLSLSGSNSLLSHRFRSRSRFGSR